MFVIDFDDTLFDTQAFKQARLEAVQLLGVSEEEYWNSYRLARNSPDGLYTYSNERHADMLSKLGYSRAEVLRQLESTTGSTITQFLFPDTFAALTSLKSFNQSMILLSLGNPGFQEIKTKGSGVDVYFDQLFMIHTTKEHVLEKLLLSADSTPIWFINDKVDETKKLVKAFPAQLKPVLKMSERLDSLVYQTSDLPHFDSLTRIVKYIENISVTYEQ